jgi:hypothetical protein
MKKIDFCAFGFTFFCFYTNERWLGQEVEMYDVWYWYPCISDMETVIIHNGFCVRLVWKTEIQYQDDKNT